MIIALTGQQALRVYPRSQTVWYYKEVEATITFNVDKSGKCDSLVLFQNGVKQTAKRKEDPTEALQKFAGIYELRPGAQFTVEAIDDKLMIALTGQQSLQVFPRSETVWFYKEVEATITFNLNKNGKCDSLVLFQNGKKQTAKRKKDPSEALRQFVGSYELAPDALFTVEVTDGKLMIALTGQPSQQVFARSENVWALKGIDATITFNVDKNGKCDSLVLFQKGVKQTAKRKKDAPAEVMQKFDKAIDVPAEALQKFVGKYELVPGAQFTVEAKDGKLMIALTGQPSHQVFAGTETVWFYKVVDATITFNVDKNGKCDSLVLFQNGIKQTAKRKK